MDSSPSSSRPATVRGIIERALAAHKFFKPNDDGKVKTMELRNHNLRCVPPGGRFYVVECGHGRNSKGELVMRVLGSVQFVENVHLDPSTVKAMYAIHQCSHEDFEKLRKNWKKPDVIVGWRVEKAFSLGQGRWFKPSSQDLC